MIGEELEAMRQRLTKASLHSAAWEIREGLAPWFRADTSVWPDGYGGGSHGHCAAVAVIVNSLLGGGFASAVVNDESHWFNVVGGVFVDLTGDQFGAPEVYVGDEPPFRQFRVRQLLEVTPSTLERARKLAKRAI